MKKLLFFLLLPFLFSCSTDDDEEKQGINIDFSEFQEFEEHEVNYFSNLELQENTTFLGRATRTEKNDLLFMNKVGDCGEPQVENCFDLESLDPKSGFFACKGFYGYTCYDFLVAIRNGQTEVINNIGEFRNLVGEIDELAEVVFVLESESYWVGSNNIESGAYKKVNGGYEIIVTKLISDCAPIVRNRYHLKVSSTGEIEVLSEEEYFRDENACF